MTIRRVDCDEIYMQFDLKVEKRTLRTFVFGKCVKYVNLITSHHWMPLVFLVNHLGDEGSGVPDRVRRDRAGDEDSARTSSAELLNAVILWHVTPFAMTFLLIFNIIYSSSITHFRGDLALFL